MVIFNELDLGQTYFKVYLYTQQWPQYHFSGFKTHKTNLRFLIKTEFLCPNRTQFAKLERSVANGKTALRRKRLLELNFLNNASIATMPKIKYSYIVYYL